ncbi:phage virion morphogenesis protein [Glaciimonas sp. CA11.2]|uniref:phage virion morphogenesis protein n=1 Tax=Glaciimonas sp. CA11.2 TaxID=3048601 RepID=UPI002AB3F861|nr:phage virion morphogenesis protein [Glaciimonas sp. CA11.2]MDY7547273.1 phage virion morphogenesis protein [Glaciimonas sp. CA11.2]
MNNDLQTIEEWAGALLLKLAPAQRRAVNKKVAQDLRRSQVKRIASQQTPDGEAYTARKQRKNLRGKSGRIKRQKAAMFAKIRKQKSLTIQQDENQLSVGFFGRVARIARVHQEGLTDKVSKKGPEVRYAARPLLGFSVADQTLIRDALLHYISNV